MSTRTILALSVGLAVACGTEQPELRSSGSPSGSPSSMSGDAGTDGGKKAAQPDARVSKTVKDAAQANTIPPPPKDGGVEICDTIAATASLVVPDMLIVLDRSGSMNPDGNDRETDRWTGSVQAIVDVTSTMDERIRFGLMTFPAYSEDGDGNECAAGTLNVKVGGSAGAAIADALEPMDANGRTPTAASLQAALKVMDEALPSDTAAPARYVLLVTDGDPNCSSNIIRGTDEAARQQTIAAIGALNAAKIKTFVVGYQTAGTEFAGQLDKMAAAGGTGETTHRSVESGTDLAEAFEQLAGKLVSCSFKLEEPVEDASYVRVTVSGKPRALNDSADGWTLASDSQTIDLTGAACAAVRAGAVFNATVECAPVQYY